MRFRDFGLASVVLSLLAQGCGAAGPGARDASSPAVGQAPMEAPGGAESVSTAVNMAAAVEEAAPEAPGAPAPAPPAQPTPPSSGRPAPIAEDPTDQKVIEQARKMVDIEARLSVEVENVRKAAEQVRKLAEASHGQITNEQVNVTETDARAEIALRVPAAGAGDFLAALDRVGLVRNRQVTVKDIGREYYDATIRLSNLEATRNRYQEILAQAKTVEEILRIEGELTRVRGEIELIKGQLRFMRDRAARATIYVSLFTSATDGPPPVLRPEAKLFPGLRMSFLRDFRGDNGGDASYLGGGLVIGFSQQAALEIQGFRELGGDTSGLDGLFLTLSGRLYSEFLGNGEREYFNPYLGMRAGYARFLSKNEFLAGGALGLELLKSEAFTVDAELRASGLFGDDGGHLGVEPSIGASVAF